MPKFTYGEALSSGIRREARSAINAQALMSASNLRALAPYGLTDFIDVTQPITNAALTSASITKTWPRPQLFRGKGVTLLADDDALFTVTESDSGNWTLSAVTIYDFSSYNFAADTASTTTIDTGVSWQFMDFWGDCWALFNGVGVVFKAGFSSKVFYQNEVTIRTGANYQDARVFYGGFDPSDTYALADWPTYWANFDDSVPSVLAAKTTTSGLGGNWIWWSSIGTDDMWWLYSLDYMVDGPYRQGFSSTNPYWKHVWGKHQAGAMPMPWSGNVVHTAQLGPAMMVYGVNGVAPVLPVELGFGLGQLNGLSGNVGVLSKGSARAAVGGDESVHAFLDETGDLNVVTPDMRVENLGRRHLFSGMTAPLISFDPKEREFWIGENDNTYVLSRTGGVSKAPMAPTTLYFGRSNNASGSVGITFANSDTTPAFETEWFEAEGQDEVLDITSLTLVGAGTWSLGVKYLRYQGDTEQSSGTVLLDGGGSTEMHMSGIAFKVYGTATDRTTAKANRIDVEFTNGTRRSLYAWLT